MDEIETGPAPVVKKNKGGRPRKTAAAPVAAAPSPDQWQQLIAALTANQGAQQAGGGLDLEALKVIISESAKEAERIRKPENKEHPGKSALAYPEGDVARPRPVLPFEFFWNGYPVHQFPETEHWRELELMCQVQPGEYTILRKDGTPMQVTVRGERDANGKLFKVLVEFPVSREEKWLVPPKSVLLYQLVHEGSPRQTFVAAMQEYLTTIVAEPDSILAVPVGV